ncbi:FixH family protein [Aliiglaciecola sp. CAU 1673]|uniref:FixH family protein n=1 Tax=Aliiglaciecola sp. CAU 1673 TaxID=3032595 RepID=UPI0023DAC955|nr:FixH family protein [Aliiglaciecola sp. CAU 1673]MDF2180163.1 FixH family protein [Aliiglaciecola sp. CAU 1673]
MSAITPWYKQFWPWFLISIPLISIVLSFTMLHLATSGQDSMVIDDYYKEGKAINMRLQEIEHAKSLGIDARLLIDEQSVRLWFENGKPTNGAALTLIFHHPTLAEKDFTLMLTQDANGRYSAPLPQSIDGKWKLTLVPFDKSWKVQQDIGLPQIAPIVVKP